jgi:tRNA threonylcarbamoyladenosine biosynthesis protein TsaE
VKISGTFETHSPEETLELGRRIGQQLTGHAILLLEGDLGSGKTVFTKGVAEGLGIDPNEVTSPSFTLVNEYQGRLRLYHIDLYRLEAGGLPPLGLEDILNDEDSVAVIEWAERLEYKPGGAIAVSLSYVSDSARKIEIREPNDSARS